MVPNPTSTTFFLLVLGILAFIIIMLLPALVEWKKPKDAGPRRIMGHMFFAQTEIGDMMTDAEEEHVFDKMLVDRIAGIIAFLPNLEA